MEDALATALSYQFNLIAGEGGAGKRMKSTEPTARSSRQLQAGSRKDH